jgi:hypothetical protein
MLSQYNNELEETRKELARVTAERVINERERRRVENMVDQTAINKVAVLSTALHALKASEDTKKQADKVAEMLVEACQQLTNKTVSAIADAGPPSDGGGAGAPGTGG